MLSTQCPGREGEDDVPEAPETPISRPGDLWVLGKHRLLCGDATVATDVERLLGDVTPLLMVTDPPYGVDYDPGWRNKAGAAATKRTGKVLNDDRADWREAWGAVEGYAIGALESPRASITTLSRHFGFDAVETEGVIRFVMRGQAAVATVSPDDLVAAREGDVLELTRGHTRRSTLSAIADAQPERASQRFDDSICHGRLQCDGRAWARDLAQSSQHCLCIGFRPKRVPWIQSRQQPVTEILQSA